LNLFHTIASATIKMAAQNSISSILANTLDLIGNEAVATGDDDPTRTQSTTISASKQLLAEKNRLKRSIDVGDFIPLENNRPEPSFVPMYEQISTSVVDQPKYWKNKNITSSQTIKRHKQWEQKTK